MTTRGIVYLVGAGPGDPGLLTIRGRELLRTCDVVVYDALVSEQLLAAELGGRDVERHFVGKRGGQSGSTRQEEIEKLLVKLALEGRRVVRLKGGDPFVFGRGGEEAQALAREGIAFEIVPGVTAGIAAPAYAGIPVTHRGRATSVAFVTGHEEPEKANSAIDWRSLARVDTLVLYMGVRTLPAAIADLIAAGRAPGTPAAVIERGTLPSQRVVTGTLETIVQRARDASIEAPAVVVIGDVVALRDDIEWRSRRALSGKRIVVTRARAQASALAMQLRELGAEVLEMPAIRVELLDPAPLYRALDALASYQWVVFTSQNTVEVIWRTLRERGRDTRAFAGARIAAIGPATAEALLACGIVPDLVPAQYVGEALADAVRASGDLTGARVLIGRAESARDVVPDVLRASGAHVDVVGVYRTVADARGAPELRSRLLAGEVDLVTVTSSSTVRYFVDAVGADAARGTPVASIGPVTTAT
ncbi:MAG: uroporphyrinogen-III C-methyltransferase, partial [Gemmatimonadota bacterium]|nr:uroporphyrinogen-III C-methyltransferase [Gemmatimonadota bacterium]